MATPKQSSLMPRGVVLTKKLPEAVRLAIADAVVVFGRIEQETIEIAWLLFNSDLAQKPKIARSPAQDNFKDIISVIERVAPESEFEALKKTIEMLAAERNLIVHGSWNMADEKPWVVWHKFIEDDDSVVGEYFEFMRFERFMSKANHLLSTLYEFHNQLEAISGITTSAAPRS